MAEKNKLWCLLLLLVALVVSLGCSAGRDLDEYFVDKMEQMRTIGMQVGYIGPGGVEWHGSYGIQNYETGEAVNDSTLFMIASCSKACNGAGGAKTV